MGTRNQKLGYEVHGVKNKSVQCVKNFGVPIESNFKYTQQYSDASGKANIMLGFINRNFPFKNKDTILPLYISLVKPHLEIVVHRRVARTFPRGRGGRTGMARPGGRCHAPCWFRVALQMACVVTNCLSWSQNGLSRSKMLRVGQKWPVLVVNGVSW